MTRTYQAPLKAIVAPSRRGSALILVLIATVVLAVLASGGVLGAMQELRSAHNEQMVQRALSIAQYGVNQQLAAWPSRRMTMATGAVDSSSVVVTPGDTAWVKVMRLTTKNFWITSVGRTKGGNGRLEVKREVSLLVGVSRFGLTPGAALTTYGQAYLDGASKAVGTNTTPTGWTDCAPYAGRDTFAIAYNPKSSVLLKDRSKAIGGSYADPNAADTLSYTTFGTETWNSLVKQAEITASQNFSPSPIGTDTTCVMSSRNWGEPFRTPGAVLGCKDYFPIIYSAGQLELQSGRGQGVLIVDGDLHLNGSFTFAGLVLVRGEVHNEGNSVVYGAVMAMGKGQAIAAPLDNSAVINYSTCAFGRAVNKLGGVASRVPQRAWAQMF